MRGVVQVGGCVVLSAVSAELLAAYADNTGRLGPIMFAVVFFTALYGAPALLVREITRRAGWGWDSMLLLMLSLAIAQACLIDQSLFSEDYQNYDGWTETYQATLIPAVGVSVYNAFNFILGHVIYSFGAPIALAEAWKPHKAEDPWLKAPGLILAAAAYFVAAGLIISDPESQNASVSQLLGASLLVIACVGCAYALGKRHQKKASHGADEGASAPAVATVFAVMLALACLLNLTGEDWWGVAMAVAVTTVGGALIVVSARRRGWGLRHVAAVALAFLVSRGVLAFTYEPLTGTVAAWSKYTHNAVMLSLVLVAGWCALKIPGPSSTPGRSASA
ncbi:hypothetical protein HF877_01370 [Rhodococcus sp. BL-253-APC-6A1W]|nr:hypothetical protein [Rhodococcus sp. BL-253-APC-6A1W]